MVMVNSEGYVIPHGKKRSKSDELKGQIMIDTLLLKDEKDNGFRRVYDRIEELQSNIEKCQKELAQIDGIEINEMKYRRTKPSKWNWR